ncbi:MAG: branched-chain amino acid aminotransferase [Oscillospiraceae bacterium]|nr:branched-chain amino acid aminotransferase [Oscillospiraceae bacterium]
MELRIEKAETLKELPSDESKLGFGNYFTDHMFIMNYDKGEGWHDGRIVPYGPIELYPAAMVLHYAQEVFEGLKAYRGVDDNIRLFRPKENFKRLNFSNDRISIPLIDEEYALNALKELIKLDSRWVPKSEGCSLYIRPFIFATDPFVGVRSGEHFLFIIILSPVGSYYPTGLDPVRIYTETNYVRAVKGGTGMTKTGGNYAASIKAQNEAKKMDFSQVLWLDGVEKKYIEEVGTMNVFFVIGDEVVTPLLDGSILSGITRMSVIELLKSWGLTVSERKLSIDEVVDAHRDGRLKEAFGTGTAAVISPIGELRVGESDLILNDMQIGVLSRRLYDTLTGIQWGTKEDSFGWSCPV